MTGYPLAHIPRARRLRRDQTDAEKLIWSRLRAGQIDGLKFRRQQPIGHYVVDFVCHERGLIIEADGGQHAETRSDEVRDRVLTDAGYSTLRFWNHDILGNIDGVTDAIRSALATTPSPSHRFRDGPLPLPQGERGLRMEHHRG